MAQALPKGPFRGPAGGAWVLDEPLANHDVGEVFTLPGGAVLLGDRALAEVGQEVAVLKHLTASTDLTEYAHTRNNFLKADHCVRQFSAFAWVLDEPTEEHDVGYVVTTSKLPLGAVSLEDRALVPWGSKVAAVLKCLPPGMELSDFKVQASIYEGYCVMKSLSWRHHHDIMVMIRAPLCNHQRSMIA